MIEWAKRKMSKNPFGMLVLLSARSPEVSSSSWGASISQGELILLNLEIHGEFFIVEGFGASKTKARKDATSKII